MLLNFYFIPGFIPGSRDSENFIPVSRDIETPGKCPSLDITPYISRESYNEDLSNNIQNFLESYKESDLNDFFDRLERTDKLDDSVYEQLLADIKAEVGLSKQSSSESLASVHSLNIKKSRLNSSQDSLSSMTRSRAASAAKKFDRFKARVRELMKRKKKKDKIHIIITNECNESDSITVQNLSVSPQNLTPEKKLKREMREISLSDKEVSLSPETKREKKGFKFSNLLRKDSPKPKKKSKNIRSDNTYSESEPEEGDALASNELSLTENACINNDNKKGVRFLLSNKETSKTILNIDINEKELKEKIVPKDDTNENNAKACEYLPTSVTAINNQNDELKSKEFNHEESLPILYEQIKPLRRKKKKMIPVSVDGIPIDNTSLRSSGESDCRNSCEIIDEIQLTEANLSVSASKNEDKYNIELKKIVAELPNNSNIETKNRIKRQEFSSLATETFVEQLTPIVIKRSYSSPVTVDFQISHQKETKEEFHLLEIPIKSELASIREEAYDECKQSFNHDQSLPLHSNEIDPSFPESDDIQRSFYDNVNPYFEIMTKLDEEVEEKSIGMLEPKIDPKTFAKDSITLEIKRIETDNEVNLDEVIERMIGERELCKANHGSNIQLGRESNVHAEIKRREARKYDEIDERLDIIANENTVSESLSHQEACKSPVNENHVTACIDDLNSLTDEIARITDQMEQEMKLVKKQSGLLAKDNFSIPITSSSYTRRNKIQTQINSTFDSIKSSTPPIPPVKRSLKRFNDTASQTDTEYEETDFETESEIEDVSSQKKKQLHSKHFFGATNYYSNLPYQNSVSTDTPIVPPRHFQQKMPLHVVQELKSVLSDSEECGLKKSNTLARRNHEEALINGRCNINVTNGAKQDGPLAPSNCAHAPVPAADPLNKLPSLSLFSNSITNSNLISAIKSSRTEHDGRLDGQSSVSQSNLSPIPEVERAGPNICKNEKKVDENSSTMQASTTFKIRANAFPSFDSIAKIPKGKPPVPPTADKKSSVRKYLTYEDGYHTDPGIYGNIRSKSKFKCRPESGYVTDSELGSAIINDNTNIIFDTPEDNLPPRPPLPSNEACRDLNIEQNILIKELQINQKEAKLLDMNAIPCNLNEIQAYTSLTKKNRPRSTDDSQIFSTDSFIEHSKYDEHNFIYRNQPPFEKKENERSEAKLGISPESKISYVSNCSRPHTWYVQSFSNIENNNLHSMQNSTYHKQESTKSCNKESNDESQCDYQKRLRTHGLGEWLFLARLDHTNQLLSQLTSNMHLHTDDPPSANSERHNINNNSLNEGSKKDTSPEPPPRPRTPIDDRDPYQVHGEKKYLSYFSDPPRAKHPPGDQPPKTPTIQQLQAEQRYNNYFADKPRSTTPIEDLANEDDPEVIKARKRYLSYFQKGIPRPRPKSCSIETDDSMHENDNETVAAQQRYNSYFHSGPPRPKSFALAEQAPEPDEEQKAAEKRYLAYFHSGIPRRKSPVPVDNDMTLDPDKEQLDAEKRYSRYFEGLPKQNHPKKDEEETPLPITQEMLMAQKRFLKYFDPVPCGKPKRLKEPPPQSADDDKQKQLLQEFQHALENRDSRKQMKVLRVSKAKNEIDREVTPPSLREKVVEEFLKRVQDRKIEKDLHFGDTDEEEEDDTWMKPIVAATFATDLSPIIQGGGTVVERISKDLTVFLSEEGE